MSAMSSPAPAPVQSPAKPAPVRRPEPESGSRRWMVLGVVVLLLIGAVAAYRQWMKPAAPTGTAVAVRTAKAFVAPLDVTLRLAGQTSARNFANVVTPILRGPENRGNLTLLKLVKSGAPVKKGELIVEIDSQSVQDHIDDLKDTVQTAENDIQKRKAEQAVEWEAMQQTLRVSKAASDKARLDYKPAEIRTDIERELLKLSVDEAEARYKQQLADVEQRRLSQASEIKILDITLDRHKRHMGRHEHDLKQYTIYASMDGLAVMSTTFRGGDMAQFQQGDQVYPGQPVMKVVDTKSMQVEGSVSQSDSSALRLGQRVKIGLDAFKDLNFTGRVYSIGALAIGGWRQNNYIRTVPVRVMIEGSDPKLIPDLSSHCDIILETVPDQLQVPLAGVREENGKAMVMVRSGETWTSREVTLGKRNATNVAIASGLKAGEEVRLN